MSELTITIDGNTLTAHEDETILQVALRNDIYIPHLCYHPDLNPIGVCRLCFVEVDSVPVLSCKTKVENNMNIKTSTPEIDEIRRVNVEILVANHHATCKGCSAIKYCALQKLKGKIRIDKKRVLRLRPPSQKLPLDTTNPYFDYDPNKCILCEICVRTCEGIQNALYVVGRGYSSRIKFYGDSSKCASCGECVSRCPVAGLIPKDQNMPKQASSSSS